MSAIGEQIEMEADPATPPATDANGHVTFHWETETTAGFYGRIAWGVPNSSNSLVFSFPVPAELKGLTFPVSGWTYPATVHGSCGPHATDPNRLIMQVSLSDPGVWASPGYANIYGHNITVNQV